jgi:hypothetical protein
VRHPRKLLKKQPKVEQPKQLQPLPSVAIQRLIDEVRNDKDAPLHGYNRTYHRHNR